MPSSDARARDLLREPGHEEALVIYEAILAGCTRLEVETNVAALLSCHSGAELGRLTFDFVRMAVVLQDLGRPEYSQAVLGACAHAARRAEREADDCSASTGRASPVNDWLGSSAKRAKPATIGARPPAGSVPVAQLLATQSRPRR